MTPAVQVAAPVVGRVTVPPVVTAIWPKLTPLFCASESALSTSTEAVAVERVAAEAGAETRAAATPASAARRIMLFIKLGPFKSLSLKRPLPIGAASG